MKKVITEKNSVTFAWLGTAVGLLVLCVAMTAAFVMAAVGNDRTGGRLENFYRHELYELADSAYNLETAAAKLLVSKSGKNSEQYFADLDRHAYAAAESLGKLPIEPVSASRAIGFLNRVSDYAKSDTAGYESVTESIYATARRLNEAIGDLLTLVEDGRKLSENVFTLGTDYEGEGDITFNSVDYPELIYDGPFSDGKKPACYKALEALDELSPEAASDRFARLFTATDVKILGESEYPAAYEITGKLGENPIYASLSKRGGMVLNLSLYKRVGKVDLTERDAERLAVEYAEHLGYRNMTPVWYNMNGGIAYVNLAPSVDDVIYYTDLVKVKIAMDDGTVMGVEATGYCLNHTDRELSPVMDEDTAASLVSDRLKVTSVRLCVIPTPQSEALCFEVAGTFKGLDYFVYIDAVKGDQVNVLRVIDEGQGKLTI